MEKINEQLLYDVGKESFRNSLENYEFDRVKENKDYCIESYSDELPYVIQRFQEYLDENLSNKLGIIVKPMTQGNFKIDVVELSPLKQDKTKNIIKNEN